MGFEQRIQERRFNALLEAMKAAIAAGDGARARAALEEARELRPSADELDSFALRVAAIPVVSPRSSGAMPWLQWRAVSAVALLVLGIGLLTGVDYFRSSEPAPAPASDVTVSQGTSGIVPPLTTDTLPTVEVPSLLAPVASAEDAARPGDETISEFAAKDEISLPVSLTPTPVREDPPPPPSRETPDDFVTPAVRADATPPTPAVISLAPLSTPRSVLPVVPPAPPQVTAGTTATAPPPVSAGNAPAVTTARAAIPATPPIAVEQDRVADVLTAYARAYGQLDARAARAVWPSVNERALARAFASLDSQTVSFDDCEIELRGETANASCRGRASYVGKVGSREPRTEAREWQFQLRREDGGWTIENAVATRN